MSNWQDRVKKELEELTKSIGRLREFMNTEQYISMPRPEASLLMRQIDTMNDYANILTQRLRLDGDKECD